MNIDEAAKALGVSTKTLRGYIKKGVIEARLVEGKTGKEWNIEPSSLEAFKENKESGLIYPAVEGVEKGGRTGKAIARMEKPGTMEIPGFQGAVISLGPPRASEPKRYLDSLPDILTVEEVAVFLSVSSSTVRGFLRDRTLHGVKLGRGWKVSRLSLEKFIRELLG
jgi:excisionase family DNA binding protein